jgi:heme-degrading monooxygenase HmoA
MSNDGFVLLDGANELSGPRSMWWVLRNWPKLRREMRSAPGYVAHRLWYARPYTVGLLTWWADEKSAYAFARMPEHRRFWSWAADADVTNGGWLATYRYVHGGPLWGNGVASLATTFHGLVPEPSGKPAEPPPVDRGPR